MSTIQHDRRKEVQLETQRWGDGSTDTEKKGRKGGKGQYVRGRRENGTVTMRVHGRG